jgi:hypothetical protein
MLRHRAPICGESLPSTATGWSAGVPDKRMVGYVAEMGSNRVYRCNYKRLQMSGPNHLTKSIFQRTQGPSDENPVTRYFILLVLIDVFKISLNEKFAVAVIIFRYARYARCPVRAATYIQGIRDHACGCYLPANFTLVAFPGISDEWVQ